MTPLDSNALPSPFVNLPGIDPDRECLYVYADRFPDELDLGHDCERLVTKSTGSGCEFARLWNTELGAPAGGYRRTSERVARLCGVSLGIVHKDEKPEIKAIMVAQGYMRAGWVRTVDGLFLALDVFAPRCLSVGNKTSTFSEAQMAIQVIRQQEAQVTSLLNEVYDVERAESILVRFKESWDDSLELMRMRLTRAAVAAWIAKKAVREIAA